MAMVSLKYSTETAWALIIPNIGNNATFQPNKISKLISKFALITNQFLIIIFLFSLLYSLLNKIII